MAFSKKNNIFGSNNIFTILKTLKDESILKENDSNNLEQKNNNSNVPKILKNVNISTNCEINTSKILNYRGLTKGLKESNSTITNNGIFVDNKISISFNDIKEMYAFYADYRIKLQYILLNRQKNILETINSLDNKKGELFKMRFNYNEIVSNEFKFRKCIKLCMVYQNLIELYKLVLRLFDLLKVMTIDNGINVIVMLNVSDLPIEKKKLFFESKQKIERHFIQTKNILNLLDGNFEKYKPTINQFLDYIDNTIKQFSTLSREETVVLSSKTSGMFGQVNDYLRQIINDFDPHTNCEYYVSIDLENSNPINPVGIRYCTYIKCDSEINLTIKNKKIDRNVLENISQEELEKLFTHVKRTNDDDFIRIYHSEPQMCPIININFFVENKIPLSGVSVDITNLPKNASILASIINNYQQYNKYDDEIIPVPLYSNNMFETYVNNILSDMTDDEYNNLNHFLKVKYDKEDTNNTKFIVDYLFEELVDSSQESNIIKPEMFESFARLVQSNSYYGR